MVDNGGDYVKSVKPGRGPSAMGAVGSIFVGIFGVIWTISAASMGAPGFFVLFGLFFVGMAIVQAIYHFKNATGENRMSLFDITSEQQEPDPLNQYFKGASQQGEQGRAQSSVQSVHQGEVNFCPFCGSRITDQAHRFCTACGKEIKE